jgi:hypothetical protein
VSTTSLPKTEKGRGPMSRAGHGRASSSRMTGYRVIVPDDDETRVVKLLERAEVAGTVHRGQWSNSGGWFWFNGAPGPAMRELREAIDGEHVAHTEEESVAVARARARRPTRRVFSLPPLGSP